MKNYLFNTILEERQMFREFFSFYLNKFDSKMSLISKREIEYTSFNGIYKYIYSTLLNDSIRALIKELHKYKNENLLIGETSKERFLYFEKINNI